MFPEGTQPPKPFAGALAAVKGAGGKEEAASVFLFSCGTCDVTVWDYGCACDVTVC